MERVNSRPSLAARFEIACPHAVSRQIVHLPWIDIITATERRDRVFEEDGFTNAPWAAENDELVIDLTGGDIVEAGREVAEVEGAPGAERRIRFRPGERVPTGRDGLPPRILFS